MKKFGWFFKTVAVFTALLFFSLPLMAQQIEIQGLEQQKSATGNDFFQGKMDGERDGKGSFAWFFGGFCLGLLGVILAFVIAPTPSTSSMVGRSADYIMGYTEGYKAKAKRQQGYYALGGLAVAVVFWVVLWLILWNETVDSVDDWYYY